MNCVTCSNAIRDSVWGDFKCSIHKHYVYDREIAGCKKYSKGTPQESKANADYNVNHKES